MGTGRIRRLLGRGPTQADYVLHTPTITVNVPGDYDPADVARVVDRLTRGDRRGPCRFGDITVTRDDGGQVRWSCSNCPHMGYARPAEVTGGGSAWTLIVDAARGHVLGFAPCRPRVHREPGFVVYGAPAWSWTCPKHGHASGEDRETARIEVAWAAELDRPVTVPDWLFRHPGLAGDAACAHAEQEVIA